MRAAHLLLAGAFALMMLPACTPLTPASDSVVDEIPIDRAGEGEPEHEPESEPEPDPAVAWLTGAPQAAIAMPPPKASWPAKVRAGRAKGWYFAHMAPGRPDGPHDAYAAVAASKAGARAFSRGRVEAQSSGSGTCFRTQWPGPADEGVDLQEFEPTSVPEPHVAFRILRHGNVGWIQGAHWKGSSDDGASIDFEYREGWLQIRRPRLGGFGEPYDVRFESAGDVTARGETFALFAARGQDSTTHVVVVPRDAAGALVRVPTESGPFLGDTPCALQRVVVRDRPVHKWIQSAQTRGRIWRIEASPQVRDDVDGIEVRLVHEVDNGR